MNRAERYALLLVFAIVFGSTLFFSALLYMDTYHTYEFYRHTTVFRSADGKVMAVLANTLIDTYPFAPLKNSGYNRTFSSSDDLDVFLWAIKNSGDRVVYLRTTILILNKTNLNLSGFTIIGENEWDSGLQP